jgi:YegS/Rv2252/BmrU family lipid kinase
MNEWPKLAEHLAERIGPFNYAETMAPDHATTLTRQAIRMGADLVIAVGGDGTLNEVVNGFCGVEGSISTHVSLGMISLGTGSDFVRSLPASGTHGVDRIASGATRRIDLGRVTYLDDDGQERFRLFANVASFGVSGEIDRALNTTRHPRFLPRKAQFLAATVAKLMAFRSQKIRMIIDDGPAISATIVVVAVANGRYFGGGMQIAPDAELDDGLFDIVTLQGTSKLVLLRDLQMVYTGRHRDHPAISIRRGRRITVEPFDQARPILIDLDGEAPGRLPATYDLLPRVLNFRC